MHLPPCPVGPATRFAAAAPPCKHLLGILLTLWLGLGAPAALAQAAQPAPRQPQQNTPNAAPRAGQPPRANANARPRFRLTTLEPVVGGEVTLSGRNLRPGSQVTARLTAPHGGVSRMSARVEEGGQFSMVLSFPSEGTYGLVVRGQGLQMTRTLEARPPRPTPQRPPQPKAPQAP